MILPSGGALISETALFDWKLHSWEHKAKKIDHET